MIGYLVVGGWLGSGKTTYVNGLLASADVASTGERLAVIVNDVGELNIDATLIAGRDGDVIELTNGCVCCSVAGSLALTMKALVERAAPPARIVVECSGVADPARAAAYGDRRRLRQDGIVVTVDVTDIERRLADPHAGAMYRQQIATADAVVATHRDLLTPAHARAALARIVELCPVVAPGLQVHTRTWRPAGAVDPGHVAATLRHAGLWRAKGYVSDALGRRWFVERAGDRVVVRECRRDDPALARVADGVVLIAAEAAQLRDAGAALGLLSAPAGTAQATPD